jgi:hypothetical protein
MRNLLLLSVTLLAVLSKAPLFAQSDSTVLPHVRLRVVDPSGQTLRSLPESDSAVGSSVEVLTAGETAKGLLQARGILSNADALAWLYSVNPYIVRIDSLAVGTSIRIPRLRTGSEAEEAVRVGNLIAFEIAPALRDSARAAVQAASQAVAALPGSRRADALERAVRVTAQVRLMAAASTPAVIELVKSRAERIGDLALSSATATPAEAREITAEAAEYERELREVAADVARGEAVKVDITVSLVYDDDNSPASGFAMRWQAAGPRASCSAWNCGAPFQQNVPKPITSMNLGGDYVVWAVRGMKQYSCDTPINPVKNGNLAWEVRVFRSAPPPSGACK